MSNRYPVYIVSHNRSEGCFSAEACVKYGVDFYLVLEPSQVKDYRKVFDKKHILVLTEDGDGISRKRNKIIKHARKNGFCAVWQIDDKSKDFFYKALGKPPVKVSILDTILGLEAIFDSYRDLTMLGPSVNAYLHSIKQEISFSLPVYSFVLISTDKDLPKFRKECLDDLDFFIRLGKQGKCVARSNLWLRSSVQVGSLKGGNTTTSIKQIKIMNQRVINTAGYHSDCLKIIKENHIKGAKRADGVYQIKETKRFSTYFKQRPAKRV